MPHLSLPSLPEPALYAISSLVVIAALYVLARAVQFFVLGSRRIRRPKPIRQTIRATDRVAPPKPRTQWCAACHGFIAAERFERWTCCPRCRGPLSDGVVADAVPTPEEPTLPGAA